MKCVSLWQPWATLMAIGAKQNETRSWPTSHRGPLAIQAAKRWTKAQREFCQHPRVRKRLEAAGIYAADLLPRGSVVCVVDLFELRRTDDLVEQAQKDLLGPSVLDLSLDELCFGDYTPGRWIWRTRNVQKLDPIPCRGYQGLFEIDDPIARVAPAGAGLRDKLYWRPISGRWHCFKKLDVSGWASLCASEYVLGSSGGQSVSRPPPMLRCGQCDGQEIKRRGVEQSMPESKNWRDYEHWRDR
jgi:hypothetical protein